ncbi:GIY-YIG nuclease family protein [Rhodohalobacter mucosus]|uniref:Endonuclease n=1 Tax=Rhodohalobacter mucosus TaxID=2079485 RepID=A0A316TNW1_9BACT|nr:GIY-YIG nuclease family protein [Rhodohalobacter mucosus]PWN05468.1 endonuclease [Rhodohalobacter mucosus]
MFTVYVLHSSKYDKIYIGHTSNLTERMKSHNELGTKGWTVKYRPWKLIHTEQYATKSEAIKREKQLKTSVGRRWIRANLLS